MYNPQPSPSPEHAFERGKSAPEPQLSARRPSRRHGGNVGLGSEANPIFSTAC